MSWKDMLMFAEILRTTGRDPSEAFKTQSHLPFIGLVKNGLAQDNKEALFIDSLMGSWLLARFMSAYPPLLSSATGQTIRATPLIYLHADRLDWCSWRWPPSQMTEFSYYFKLHRENGFGASDIDARFCAIDVPTGTVSLKNNSMELFRLASNAADVRSLPTLALVTPFVGWAVCWNPEDIPKKLSEVLDAIGLGDADLARQAENPTAFGLDRKDADKGRLATVVQYTNQAFPDGKGTATWTEVEAKVGYSRRHIIRAFRKVDSSSSWAKGGQN